jgi:transposase
MAVLTDRAEVSRLEVVETGRRRRWTEEEKLRIVAESLSGPRQVSSTARRHGIPRSLLTTWRRQFRVRVSPDAEAVPEFAPAVVVPEASAALGSGDLPSTMLRSGSPGALPKPMPAASSSRMEIVTTNRRRVIVDAGVDVAALERVLDLLERRG